MALQDYITEADVVHDHIRKFIGTPKLQRIVEEANDWYEEVAGSLGLGPQELKFPIPLLSKQYLRDYVNLQFSNDSVCNNGQVTTEDMYLVLMNLSTENCITKRALLTRQILTGTAGASMDARTMRFGKAVRTS